METILPNTLIARLRHLENFCKINYEDQDDDDTEITEERLALIEKIMQEKISQYNTESMEDLYTPKILQQEFTNHKNYVIGRVNHKHYLQSKVKTSKGLKNKVRLPGIPEDISENMIKMLIRKVNGDESCTWNCDGDLYSDTEKKQECKCFTSDAPISFTPSSGWNVIYFLDAREWLDNKFVLYRLPLAFNSDIWQNIKVNGDETFGQKAKKGQRPRRAWNLLFPQIKDYAKEIWSGTFEDIIE